MKKLSYMDFMRRWKLWIRPLVVTIYSLILTIFVLVLVSHAYYRGFTDSDLATLIGGLFIMIAIPISLWEIVHHLVYFNYPSLQKHIIRILCLVPIYSLNAWLDLIFVEQRVYLDKFRECYEAYAIYNFLKYLLNYLHEETNFVESLESKPPAKHLFPLCCLPAWKIDRDFIDECKHGLLQFTIFRPLLMMITFVCELNGVYGDMEWRVDVAFPYINVLNNISQFIAMYCLISLYRASREDLEPIKPVGKFLCIKALVILSAIQAGIISILASSGKITGIFVEDSDPRIGASKLQNFMICIEMFLAAIAHHYCFSYKPYLVDKVDETGCWESFATMWNSNGRTVCRNDAKVDVMDIRASNQKDATKIIDQIVVEKTVTNEKKIADGPREAISDQSVVPNPDKL